MKFDSTIFGVEKDGSFNSSINAIYQSAFGEDIYKSIEEKAANLLYFITKNHSFVDGNKRIAASIFASSKATLLGKASPLGLAAGYGLTTWQYYNLFTSIFTTPDFENSRWILY